MKSRPFIPVLIIAAVLWAYHNGFTGPFIFDDVLSIVDNPHIRHLWPIREAMSAPLYCPVAGRPVVCLSLALNYALGGLNVWGYHAFNLAVHLLSALALFGILRRTFEGERLRDRFGAAAVWLAAAIALIWEVHPLQTESVTYIVQRTELLMGLFLLLTLYGTLRGSRSSRPGVWYLAAVVSCALGMGSKEVMVGAPLIVLLYDRVFLATSFRQLWQRRAGLYLGMAATWIMLGFLVAGAPNSAARFGVEGLTSWDYLKMEAGAVVYYLRLCFWPRPLVIDYFDWPVASSLRDALVSGVVVIGLLGATMWAFRRRPGLGFLGAWFFLILGPTSSFLPIAGEAVAERRMYLPLAAVITLTVVGALELGRRVFSKRQGVVLGCVVGGVIVALFASLTMQRNRDYNSAVTIWQDTVEKRPNNPRAHNNLGYILEKAGRAQEAITHYEQALRLKPDYADAHNNLGIALMGQGKLREAVEHWEQALRVRPDYPDAHYNLGIALERAGRVPEAISQYKQALQINPDYAEAHNNLGAVLVGQGRQAEAVEEYEKAVRDKPDYPEAHYNLGFALVQLGRVQEGIEHYEEALRIRPDFAEAEDNLGIALLQTGRVPEAIHHYEQALRIKPDLAEAHNNLGAALVAEGRLAEAIKEFEQAVRIKPDYAQAQSNLAQARAAH